MYFTPFIASTVKEDGFNPDADQQIILNYKWGGEGWSPAPSIVHQVRSGPL